MTRFKFTIRQPLGKKKNFFLLFIDERREIRLWSKAKHNNEATKFAIEMLLKKDEPGMNVAIKEAMGPDQASKTLKDLFQCSNV